MSGEHYEGSSENMCFLLIEFVFGLYILISIPIGMGHVGNTVCFLP